MGSGSSSSSVSLLTGRQKKVSQKIGDMLLQNLGKGAESYTGEIFPTTQPAETTAQSLLNSWTGGSEYDPQIASVLQSALGGQAAYDVSPDAISQYFNQAVTNPMMRTWRNEIAPKINETYARAGALFSTRRNDTVRQSLSDISSQLSSGLGNWQYQGMSLAAQLAESARARQLAGVELANQQVMQPVFRAQALSEAQRGLTGLQAARNEAAYNEWLRTRPESSPWLKLGMAYLGTPMQENVFGPSPFAQVSDLVGGLGGAAASYFGQKSMANALAGLGGGNTGSGTASTASGVAGGATSGAALGTAVFPGVGTIVGGMLGGLSGLFGR